jgi:uncharacterized tellurite resistance protein B-like protein
MASIDGYTDVSERVTSVIAMLKFTDAEIKPIMNKYFGLKEKLGNKRMFDYLSSCLTYFKDNLSASVRVEILRELEEIAKADGVIHENEGVLFHYVAKELGIEIR